MVNGRLRLRLSLPHSPASLSLSVCDYFYLFASSFLSFSGQQRFLGWAPTGPRLSFPWCRRSSTRLRTPSRGLAQGCSGRGSSRKPWSRTAWRSGTAMRILSLGNTGGEKHSLSASFSDSLPPPLSVGNSRFLSFFLWCLFCLLDCYLLRRGVSAAKFHPFPPPERWLCPSYGPNL